LYDWRVRATCSAGTGNYIQAQFTTTGTAPVCSGQYDISSNGTSTGGATIPLNTDVTGFIEVRGDNDYYKFTITSSGSIIASLTNLPADYQLSVLDVSGNVLQSSVNTGTNNETISRDVAAGTYYARVYPKNNGAFNANSCYTLSVQTGTAFRMISGNETPFSNKLIVSPNPAGYKVNLAINIPESGTATISVINQTGAIVLTKKLAVSAGDNIRNLDVNNLANGVYYIKVQTGSVIQIAKLVVAK